MPSLENGILTYTSEQMNFNFETENYIFHGNKFIEGGVPKRLDGGFINRKSQDASAGGMDQYVGNYSVRVETVEGVNKIKVSLNDVNNDEYLAVYADLNDLIIATGIAPNE